MARILVFQHVPFELLGTLNPLLRRYGLRIRYVNFGRDPHARPRLDGYAGLVVLGGPMNVDEVDAHPHLATEVALVGEAIERDMPVLGICLGAQIVARTLGAEVGPNATKEIGWYDVAPTEAGASDPLIRHFGPQEKVFQWHGDAFTIPAGAVHLASSPTCDGQAFRYGDRVYGLQFHLEVDERLIERWLTVPVHRRELEALHGQVSPHRIRRQTPRHIGRTRRLADRVFGEWIERAGGVRRRDPHPHGT